MQEPQQLNSTSLGFFAVQFVVVSNSLRALSKAGSLDKLETTLQAILQVGVFELISPLETPTEVVINEYVDLTHAFYEKQTVGLVNGVLDKVALLRKQKNLG